MFEQIDASELKSRIDAKAGVVLLDVRRQDEWDEFHLDGAIHIPLQELESRLPEIEEHKNSDVVVYCRSGNRSAQACMLLQIVGFTRPINLKGGLLSW